MKSTRLTKVCFQIFKGHLRHIVTCSKRHVNSDEVVPFWNLPLSMEDNNNYSVVGNIACFTYYDGYENFFKPSTVSGDKTDAIIVSKMEHPPEILTLLLKRFEFDYHMMSYNFEKNCNCELYAFVDHVGSLRSGHYIAVIQSYEDHNWYMLDDTCVSQLNSKPFEQDEF
ncbi:unnamed protein product [Coregonus sp. 'balchen']|nr:unnamed protein product [Coregonus sp. 'balchen']